MLNIAICDDNLISLNELIKLTEEFVPIQHMIKPFAKSTELIDSLNDINNKFDIVITDINMPEIDGIQLAKRLKNQHPNICFIFVTAFTDYIQDVFTVNPVYYILKPVSREKFSEAIALAINRINVNKKKTVNIISKNKTFRIMADDIQYIESRNRTAIIHLLNSVLEFNIKLDNIEKLVPESFVRCHKSFLVNMNLIREIGNNAITLFSGDVIPVAKARFKATKETIVDYWGNSI